MEKFTYTIEQNLGILSQNPHGWTKEFNIVSWNGHPAKYDLREWGPEHEKMAKGLTFSVEEMRILKASLAMLELD